MATRDLSKALAMIKEFEGFRPNAYLDSTGVPTIGFGETVNVHMGQTCTLMEADLWLQQTVSALVPQINAMIKAPLNDNEFCALIDFCYNLGVGSLYHSHLLTYLNQGRLQTAAEEFPKWNHAGGVELPGLTRRRFAEMDLFLS